MWHRKGQRLSISTPGKNVRVAVCGAYRYPEGPFLFTHGPKSVNSALFVRLVHKLVRRAKRTGRRIVLVLDNGGAFTSNLSLAALATAAEWVRPFWLPKYTSERLNRIEGLWGHLKDDYFSRMLTRRRERFYAAAVKLLDRLHRRGALRTLFGAHLPR
jgi:transposase